ncbi:hypothetical protein [Methylobacterium haplocladii]|uniref:Uncharacterized protein n=1 Tax=Methylobacterium haplocladii TaxID=1176176 RepID=A0A512INT6_9HYPH|nr:hypothetical protein [Methylobacterium haplocladii]GEO99298.1 hypothetical protein MHA02_16860 [Methylobacterium haplocladii]GJD83501.1 hypothetical protein HPGCJGGD_1369 [Methylobacterium haplocladii]GLS61136.1 hypothetical protein GCM10007887_38320 [Methylobacterium haplocladii]
MDVATAKTLVSLTLIVAIAIFSYVSIEMFVRQMVKDLRVAWTERAAVADTRHE